MVEFACRPELIHVVALRAFARHGALVEIIVARETRLLQPEEGQRSFLQFTIGDVVRHMALPTIHRLVATFQFIPGKRMIEGLLIESDHLELPTVVLAVAGETILCLDH